MAAYLACGGTLERLELAGASLWQPRWGGTEKRDGGAGLKVRTLCFKEHDHMTPILNCRSTLYLEHLDLHAHQDVLKGI